MEVSRAAEVIKVRKKLTDLKDAEYSPRKKLRPEDPEYQKIARSIEAFGYCDPIIINQDGTIIGGHQRKQILLDYGYQEADCVQVNLDKQSEKALNIALNKITGQWDDEKLKDLLIDLDLENIDISLTGFEKNEIEELIDRLTIADVSEEDGFNADAALNEIEEPTAKRGDIWVLGNHRLMCGDSTDPGDIQELMGGERIDLVITDPPYNVDYGEKERFLEKYRGQAAREISDIQNDAMSQDQFYRFLLSAFQRCFSVMRDGAAIYVFHSEGYGLTFRQVFQDAGLKLSQCLIWEKNQFVLGRQDYQWRHEPILYGWKEGAAHYFISDRTQDTVILEDDADLKSMNKQELVAYIENMIRSHEDLTSVIFENKPNRSAEHPTMKPITLIGKLMKNSSKPRWNVLDLFGGSGSTLIAAEQLQRNSFLMELDPRFCDVIIRRWEEYTGRKAVLLNDKCIIN